MSITFPRKPEAPTDVRVLWSSPEANLWVANRGGEYAGLVEFADGHFVARDRTNTVINSFTDIPSAKAAVLAKAEAPKSLFAAVTAGLRLDRSAEPQIDARLEKNYRRSA